MRKEDINGFLGKRVKIVLKNGYFYTGEITKLNEDSLHFLDRYNHKLVFSLDVIDGVLTLGGGRE